MKVIAKYTVRDDNNEKGRAVFRDVTREVKVPDRKPATPDNIKIGDVLVKPGFHFQTGNFAGFITTKVIAVDGESFKNDSGHWLDIKNWYLCQSEEL